MQLAPRAWILRSAQDDGGREVQLRWSDLTSGRFTGRDTNQHAGVSALHLSRTAPPQVSSASFVAPGRSGTRSSRFTGWLRLIDSTPAMPTRIDAAPCSWPAKRPSASVDG